MVRIATHSRSPRLPEPGSLRSSPPPSLPDDGQGLLLTHLLAHLPVIAGRCDERGVVTEIDGAGLARFGIPNREIVGANLLRALPDLQSRFETALAGTTVNFHWEGMIQRELCHLEVHFFAVPSDKRGESGIFFFVRDLTENKKLEREVLAISEAEQQRIGADLHDGLGQHLTGIACLASALSERLHTAGNPEEQAAEEIARLVQDAISQTRALARGLSPVQIEHYGLQSALESLAYEVERLHRIECRFHSDAATPIYDHAAAINLYRIAQEAINNALKHGKAARIEIGLRLNAKQGEISIRDNGTGFSTRRSKKGSLGLRIMGYRASLIGATLEISSRPRHGTIITCRFPNPS